MGEQEEAGGGGGTEWEGLRWSGRRAGDKETSASAILEEQTRLLRRLHSGFDVPRLGVNSGFVSGVSRLNRGL